jgi:phosphate:Na+ symporter
MEERELTDRFCSLLDETLPILTTIYKGFFGQKLHVLKEAREKFRNVQRQQLPFLRKLLEERDKDPVQKEYANLVPHVQRVALSLDNLVDKMEIKVDARILFSQKALDEIKQLMVAIEAEFRDVRDYVKTRNPSLKTHIKEEMEQIRKMIDEFELVHQNRLITGVCVPQASYIYIEMTDNLKRIARELSALTDTLA